MFRRLSISKRFGLILFMILIITLPLVIVTMHYFFYENAKREVEEKAVLAMSSMLAIKKYIGSELRPTIQKTIPGKFVLEGTSGFYIIRKISYHLQKFQPDYIYKQATDNPLTPVNRADYFEEKLLRKFQMDPDLKDQRGLKTEGGPPFYYIATPVRVDRKGCMKCHGDKTKAPKPILAKYGTESGYGYKMNTVVGTNIIYVPASVPLSIAYRSTAMVAVVFVALFFILFVIINTLIRRSIIRPIESFVDVADQVSKGKFDNKFEIDTKDELRTLADAFTRLKTSLVMMMDMVRKSGNKQ